jgi:hypothetical protein
MVGYIVADSIIQVAPVGFQIRDTLIKMSAISDTMGYLLKYMYLLDEYNPLRYLDFWTKIRQSSIHSSGYTTGGYIHGEIYMRMYNDPRLVYVWPSYILHVYVNHTEHIDTAFAGKDSLYPNFSETIAYCQILDTLKGTVFPSLSNSILSNGQIDTFVIGEDISIPDVQTTDIVFQYFDQKSRGGMLNHVPLFDANGNYWVKPNQEYIVFLEFTGCGGNDTTSYFELMPYPYPGSYSMYPIIEGNVIDEGNVLGWGTSVPIATFKQKIMEQINAIKHFGE